MGAGVLSLCYAMGAQAQVKNKADSFPLCRKRMALVPVQRRGEDKHWRGTKQRRNRAPKVRASTAFLQSSERRWQR